MRLLLEARGKRVVACIAGAAPGELSAVLVLLVDHVVALVGVGLGSAALRVAGRHDEVVHVRLLATGSACSTPMLATERSVIRKEAII